MGVSSRDDHPMANRDGSNHRVDVRQDHIVAGGSAAHIAPDQRSLQVELKDSLVKLVGQVDRPLMKLLLPLGRFKFLNAAA